MNKRHLHLYVAFFLASLLLSATIISVYAADSQQTTTITYEAPASAEENIYEILIPSSMEILHNENSKAIYVEIADNYHLTPSYVVHVDLSPSSFNDDSSVTGKNQYIRLYNTANSNYYYTLSATDSSFNPLFYSSDGNSSLEVATFHSTKSKNTGGALILNYVPEESNYTTYHGAATYTGSVTFDIYGRDEE